MMNNMIYYGIILEVAAIFTNCHVSENKIYIQKNKNNTGIEIVYGTQVRLQGCQPFATEVSFTFSQMTAKKEVMVFKDQHMQEWKLHYEKDKRKNVLILWMSGEDILNFNQIKELGCFFEQIPGYKKGVAIWRYKPWNAWTKPVKIDSLIQLMPDDVQFFYWQYSDGLYGAAIPLGGNGYRTTLGNYSNGLAAKASTLNPITETTHIPLMAIGFGKDPYLLFKNLYEIGLIYMGKKENLRKYKTFPAIFEGIGWCTWNSSDMGQHQDENHLRHGADYFYKSKFPLQWILIDDGWSNSSNGMINSFEPNPQKFPNGFKPIVEEVKSKYGIQHVGLWHAFNGHWNGINPNSELGNKYKNALFVWTQKERVDIESSPRVTYYFIAPTSNAIEHFYDSFHRYLKSQGIDFIKVDNQLVTERMAVDNYPVFYLSERMHQALYRSASKYFNYTVINCMDMTVEAYYNFEKSAVARTVEDYFEYDPNETYNLQKGNAAAHVLQAIYNSLYFSQMIYTDFDMFQSHNPNATMHAIARALSGGPIYITDRIGQSKFEKLWPLIYSDGRILRSQNPLLPSEECLFQVQDPLPFKAFTINNDIGILAVFNCADTDTVFGTVGPADVHGLVADHLVLYDFFEQKIMPVHRNQKLSVVIPRMGYKLYYFIPLRNGNAAIGLVDKYNSPVSLLHQRYRNTFMEITLYEGGTFGAVLTHRPSKILVNGKPLSNYNWSADGLLLVKIPVELKNCVVKIFY